MQKCNERLYNQVPYTIILFIYDCYLHECVICKTLFHVHGSIKNDISTLYYLRYVLSNFVVRTHYSQDTVLVYIRHFLTTLSDIRHFLTNITGMFHKILLLYIFAIYYNYILSTMFSILNLSMLLNAMTIVHQTLQLGNSALHTVSNCASSGSRLGVTLH